MWHEIVWNQSRYSNLMERGVLCLRRRLKMDNVEVFKCVHALKTMALAFKTFRENAGLLSSFGLWKYDDCNKLIGKMELSSNRIWRLKQLQIKVFGCRKRASQQQ